MPDYDPKSIPILDDIIEGEIESENTDSTETSKKKIIPEEISVDSVDTENMQDDNTLDLFNDGIKDDAETIATLSKETEAVAPTLINYQIEEDDDIQPDDVVSGPSVTLDSIVDDVVKQLMPDLEQQLRFFVQQALVEKLPEKIVRQLSAEISSESDK